ncbi:MAG: exonuclease SbcCD subunit D [Anaerococcus sp.]|nr:exonuclease SbcCD subunit D [Anaerococcus sp.]
MRLLHLSDLHLGKNLGPYSLIEEQNHALGQILEIIRDKKIDLVMIAGDIFDTSIPPAKALDLYSDFIEKIVFDYKKPVLAISGNHDSPKRLDINRRFFRSNNYFLQGDIDMKPLSFEDEFGPINFYLIPFISLNKARNDLDSSIEDFSDIYHYLLKDLKYEGRNILITHAYARDMGEKNKEAYNDDQKPLSIGGSDFMDASLFDKFDYVALGHLHRAHFVRSEKIRYSGTFMKYSFDEIKGSKSVTIVDLKDKISIEKIPIKALRDIELREGFFEDLLKSDPSDSYIKFILKDDYIIENAMAKLKEKFDRAVSISYANRGVFDQAEDLDINLENKDLIELFDEFYTYKMGDSLSDEDLVFIRRVGLCDQED